jgi:osmotically inducible protein OsmC
MPVKSASAVWNGTLVEGSGHLKTQSGKLDPDYGWKSRAENGLQTNPEELIAAAHAGCFSMALSHILTSNGHPPTKIETSAKVSFDKVGDGFEITKITLESKAVVPGLDAAGFQKFAGMAKGGCPVSKALAAVPIELVATLAGGLAG